eukprot:SAG22_NODE_276_length_13167_cov_8.415825_6_plen_53_part_00
MAARRAYTQLLSRFFLILKWLSQNPPNPYYSSRSLQHKRGEIGGGGTEKSLH